MPHDEEPPPFGDDDAPPADNVTPLPTATAAIAKQAEQALLASILRIPEQVDNVRHIIGPDDFDNPQHEIIWDAAIAVLERDGTPPDHVLITKQLLATKQHTALQLLAGLETPNPANAAHYARIVHDEGQRRRVSLKLRSAAAHVDTATPETWHARLANVMDDVDAALDFTRGTTRPLHTDLTWLLNGQPPQVDPPAYVRRSDGNALFYPARVNGIFGDPETAKSWIAQVAIVEALTAGQRAALVDVDHNGANLTTHRLLLLGATIEQLANPNLFRYCEPTDGLDLLATIEQLVDFKPAVAVLDSIGEIMPMLGIKSVDNDELSTGLRQTATALANAGACVITVDHLPKSSEARTSGFAIGGTAKKRAMDGAYLHADAKVPPAPGAVGRIILRIEKDRPGRLRESCGGKYVGTFTLDSTNDGITTTSITNEAPPSDDGTWRPTHLMERISRYVEENPGASKNLIEISVKGKATHKRQALELLILDAYIEVVKGTNRTQEHHAIKPYREGDEDRD